MKAAKKSQRRKRRKTKKARQTERSPRRSLRKAIGRFLPESIFAKVETHGNTQWSVSVLACVGLLWSLSGESTLGDRYEMAIEIAGHWFPGQFLATSYRGFINALVTHNAALVRVVSAQLRTHMLSMEQDSHQIDGRSVFVVDSSKFATPWTAANEQALGKKGRKPKGKKCRRKQTDMRPQLTLTLLWHMHLGLPWAWKHGGLAEGERTQFRKLLDQLPPASLVVADAGFVGYPLWQALLDSHCQFLIRVGGNVELLQHLLPGCELEGDGEVVWLWPEGKRQKNHPPLKLRLITVIQGKQTWHLVTSLLDSEPLTAEKARVLYTRRWGVECYFRTLKQTFERSKMLSYTPECAAAELDWSLLSLWLISLLAKQELLAVDIDPEHFSPAGARRLVRRELRHQSVGKERLDVSAFQAAVKDSYKRTANKKARHDQRKKRDPAPKAPKLTAASKAQRQAAQALEQQQTQAV